MRNFNRQQNTFGIQSNFAKVYGGLCQEFI